jgi:hypothetical protein
MRPVRRRPTRHDPPESTQGSDLPYSTRVAWWELDDGPGVGNTLRFAIDGLDQTDTPAMLSALSAIELAHPPLGQPETLNRPAGSDRSNRCVAQLNRHVDLSVGNRHCPLLPMENASGLPHQRPGHGSGSPVVEVRSVLDGHQASLASIRKECAAGSRPLTGGYRP